MTCVIETKEGREVAIVDLPGACLHADNEDDVVMSMRGRLMELMVMVAPQMYHKFITTKKGQKVLYVRVQKALYGMLKRALLFNHKLRMDLENMGFKVNPYDPCVANKIVKGSQMTVTCHVDDLKISHADGWKVTQVIKKLARIYGDIKVRRGRHHEYLEMDINYGKKGQVQVSMKQYVKNIIKNISEDIGLSTAATSAADHLFQIQDSKETKLLPELQTIQFHHTVAQLLFMYESKVQYSNCNHVFKYKSKSTG